MKGTRIAILTAVTALAAQKAGAQGDAYFAHYYDMQTHFNPAAAGKEAKLNISGAYAMSMAGYENAPQTAYISGDMPFATRKTIHGVGLQLMSDKLGLFTTQQIAAQYAMRRRMGRKGWISVGVQLGMLSEKFRGSEVDVADESDPVFSSRTDINGAAFDLGLGVYFQRKNWYAGISGQHLTYPTILLGDKNEMKLKGVYFATGGVNFQLRNPTLKVATSALVRSDFSSYRADVTGRLIYTNEKRMLYAGVSYSPTISVTALVGATFHGVILGYSYEFYTNGVGMKNGSHELCVGYQMDIELCKKGKNRHQTTRTL